MLRYTLKKMRANWLNFPRITTSHVNILTLFEQLRYEDRLKVDLRSIANPSTLTFLRSRSDAGGKRGATCPSPFALKAGRYGSNAPAVTDGFKSPFEMTDLATLGSWEPPTNSVCARLRERLRQHTDPQSSCASMATAAASKRALSFPLVGNSP